MMVSEGKGFPKQQQCLLVVGHMNALGQLFIRREEGSLSVRLSIGETKRR